MKHRILVIAVTLSLALSVLIVAPVFAACAGLGVELNDGSGHFMTFWTTGSCSNPTFGKGDLTLFSGTCIGNFGINQGEWSDCANQVKFVGTWPSNFAIFTYQNTNFSGRLDGTDQWKCEANTWLNLAHVDEMSSFIAESTTLNCV